MSACRVIITMPLPDDRSAELELLNSLAEVMALLYATVPDVTISAEPVALPAQSGTLAGASPLTR